MCIHIKICINTYEHGMCTSEYARPGSQRHLGARPGSTRAKMAREHVCENGRTCVREKRRGKNTCVGENRVENTARQTVMKRGDSRALFVRAVFTDAMILFSRRFSRTPIRTFFTHVLPHVFSCPRDAVWPGLFV